LAAAIFTPNVRMEGRKAQLENLKNLISGSTTDKHNNSTHSQMRNPHTPPQEQ